MSEENDINNEEKYRILECAYNNKVGIGYLSSPHNLYREAIKSCPDITLSDAKKFLEGKNSYTLMVEKPTKFKRRRFYFNGPGHTLCADVAYLNEFSQNGYKFLLFMMDCFSRFLYIFPLKTLKQSQVVPCIESLISGSIYSYTFLFHDEGKEFYNSGISKILKKYKIVQYSTKSAIKCSIVERCIKTMKRMFSKYVIEYNDNNFLDNLESFVLKYNLTPHNGLLGECPLDVFTSHNDKFINNLKLGINRKHFKTLKTFRKELQRGQVVRISCRKKQFWRAVYIQNTPELFSIEDIKTTLPKVYILKDLTGKVLEGIFYREELIPVTHKNLYAVKILKKRKKNRKVQFLVEWVNYPSSENEWINQDQLEKL